MRRIAVITLSCLVGVLIAATSGCVRLEGEEPPSWLPIEPTVEETTVAPAEDTGDDGFPMPGDAHGHGVEVLMLGRSVMHGWFDHWGWEPPGPYPQEGYVFYYREVASPPEIGADAARMIAQVPDGTIVFFKLCFVDFEAYDSSAVQADVDENVGYARQAVEAIGDRDVTLVLGNALPQVRSSTNPALVESHRRYNAALEEIASGDPRIHVFDLYGALAGSDGTLPRGLAVSPDDSHLNATAYRVLDAELFEFLGGLP